MIGEVQDEIVPPVSEHVKVTVTGELFQPAELGKGDRAAVITGGVDLTIFSVTLAVAVFPALSVAVPEIT